MAWIESHQELARHPKTLRLARRLGVSVPAAIGHLQLLWWWAMDFAPDGSLTAFDDAEIADAVMWDGSPDALIDALSAAKFIDCAPDGEGYVIHDWQDYAGRLIERRRQDAERKRTSRGRPPDVTAPSGVTVPNRTVPDPTGPDPLPQPPPATEREGEGALPRAAQTRKTTRRLDSDANGHAPTAVAHSPPGGRSNGATRREGPVLDGRQGWAGCPAGCPTNHGGPRAANNLGGDWLALPDDQRPPWPEFLARHGRSDLADVPAPEPAMQES